MLTVNQTRYRCTKGHEWFEADIRTGDVRRLSIGDSRWFCGACLTDLLEKHTGIIEEITAVAPDEPTILPK